MNTALTLLIALAALPITLLAQDNIALTPPMGWNSWDSYGLSITEKEFNSNVAVLADKLKPYGWTYAVVDEGWYLENPEAKPGSFRFSMDAHGRYTPAPVRFPSAQNGLSFKPFSDSVHARGLKFGIHIIRGIPREAVAKNLPIEGSDFRATDAADQSDTCEWNKDNFGVRDTPAGQAYYDSLAKLYAGWGVDFLKVDCIASHPYKPGEIRMISNALVKSGRPIVLSLSPGPAPVDKAEELGRYAQMWRISNDVWDHWKAWPGREWSQSILGQFATAEQWLPYISPGHWPDADMLPIGNLGPRPGEGKARASALTHDEQRTLLTLWSMLRSPLMMGGNLTSLDDWTLSLLTNSEVIAVNQKSEGAHTLTLQGANFWMSEPFMKNDWFLAIFNLDDTPRTYQYSWTDLGLPGNAYQIRDLWAKKNLTSNSLNVTLAPHASVLYRLKEIE